MKTETKFIWAFIGPVTLIFLTNIGFLIMAATIIWRQKKKRSNKQTSSDVGGWLKAIVTLMVVMGITWIIGLAVVEREELLPLAYIFTIVAAFQGVSIFAVLVLLTKSVRDELIKWISNIALKSHSSMVILNNTSKTKVENKFLYMLQGKGTIISNTTLSNVATSEKTSTFRMNMTF